MSQDESKKISTKKRIAFIISTVLHIAGIYFLGKAAVDYALPEGTVDEIQMDYGTPPPGQQLETHTPVDVVAETPKPTPPPPKPIPTIKEPSIKPEAATMPEKSFVEEAPETVPESPVVVPPVAQEVPEELAKEAFDDAPEALPETTAESLNIPVAEPTPEPPPIAPPPPSAPSPQSQQVGLPFGSNQGVQSDRVLAPLPGNKPISYPTMARLRRVEGTSVIHYKVSANGDVIDAKIAQSSGSSLLDESALEAIKTWKFKPTGSEGVYERPIRFKLAGEAQEAPGQLRRSN